MPPANDNARSAPPPAQARAWRGVRAAIVAWGQHVHAHAGAHARTALVFGAAGVVAALLQHGAVR